MRRITPEFVFFAYLFIALQTFGYTFHRWNFIARTNFDGTNARVIWCTIIPSS